MKNSQHLSHKTVPIIVILASFMFSPTLNAAEPANKPPIETKPATDTPHPQSPEAIKQAADQLEAERKARTEERAKKREEQMKEGEEKEESKETPRSPQGIRNRPTTPNNPRPTPLPAKRN